MCGTVEQTEKKTDSSELLMKVMSLAAAVIMMLAGGAAVRLIGMHAAELVAGSEMYSEYREMCCIAASVGETSYCTSGSVFRVSAGKTLYEICRGTMIQYVMKYKTDRTFNMLNNIIEGIKFRISKGSFERLENVYMTECAGDAAEKETEHGGSGMYLGLLPQEPQR